MFFLGDRMKILCYTFHKWGGVIVFRRMFAPDSDLMIVMSWITDCIFLSFFWIVGCIPVVTIGASTAALYDAAFFAYRRKSKHSWSRFWQSYIKNLKPSLLPNILFLILLALGGSVVIHLWNDAVANGSWIVFAAGTTVAGLALGVLSVVFPMLSRFENSCGQLFGNSVRLALANLPRTILLAVINGLTLVVCLRFVLPVMILPALCAFLSSWFVEPMLKPYLPADFYETLSDD